MKETLWKLAIGGILIQMTAGAGAQATAPAAREIA